MSLRGPATRLGLGQLPLPLGPDLLRSTRQFIGRRHVTDGTVQADRVVVGNEFGDQPPSIVQTQMSVTLDVVPEPSSVVLLGAGVIGATAIVGWLRSRRRREVCRLL